jgi:hypothetical protein
LLLIRKLPGDGKGYGPYVDGWTADGKEVLIDYADRLEAYNAVTGMMRRVCTQSGYSRSWFGGTDIRYVVKENCLIDVETGTAEQLSPSPPREAAFSDDQEGMVYAVPQESDGTQIAKVELHWRECKTKRDLVLPTIPGYAHAIFVSPDKQRVVISFSVHTMPLQTCMIGFNGSSRNLIKDWEAIGWSDNRHIILKKAMHSAGNGIASIDVISGDLHILFPKDQNR